MPLTEPASRGAALAYWLDRQGHEVIIERAEHFRDGGYLIDFWGPRFDAAERMGLRPRLEEVGFKAQAVAWVNAQGKQVGGMDAKPIREIVERAVLAAAVWGKVENRVALCPGGS